MQLQTLPILLLAATLSACAGFRGEIPSKEAHFDGLEARHFALPAFERIVFDVNAMIILRMGAPSALVLSTEPDHFEHLLTNVTDGELLVQHTGHHSGRRFVKIEIVTGNLTAIQIDSRVKATFLDIEVEDIKIGFDGTGEVTFRGSCQRVQYEISAIGEFDAAQFLCHDVIANISGIGDATIFADGSLSINVSGIGDVTVLGNPRVDQRHSSGIGDVSIYDKD